MSLEEVVYWYAILLGVLLALLIWLLLKRKKEKAEALQETDTPAQVERVHRYYRTGPSAEYHGDSGAIGQVRPLRFETTGGTPKVAVAEASFGYRTRGAGPFVVTISVTM